MRTGHKEWIEKRCADGVFLLTGALQPQAGGVIIAQDESASAIQARVNEGPFMAENVVQAEILEIAPQQGRSAAGVPARLKRLRRRQCALPRDDIPEPPPPAAARHYLCSRGLRPGHRRRFPDRRKVAVAFRGYFKQPAPGNCRVCHHRHFCEFRLEPSRRHPDRRDPLKKPLTRRGGGHWRRRAAAQGGHGRSDRPLARPSPTRRGRRTGSHTPHREY